MTPEEMDRIMERERKGAVRFWTARLREKYDQRVTIPVFQFFIDKGKIRARISDRITRWLK